LSSFTIGRLLARTGSIQSEEVSSVSNPVITGIARTPIGKYGGSLAPLRAVELGGAAIAAAVERSGLDPTAIDEVLFGQVLQAGEGQITARQAAVRGGLPMNVPSVTINKVCLSGMSAIGLAERGIRAGDAKFVMTGGMESMSNAPHLVREMRWGVRIGNAEMVDVMQHDGLFCAFDQCTMGESSDHKNQRLGIGRAEQDEWAARSHQRAEEATANGAFAEEIVPVAVPQGKGDAVQVDRDDGIRPGATVKGLSALSPAFVTGGTITAGNASQISDGAAALLVADRDAAEASGTPIIAEILAYGQVGGGDATLHERPAEALSVALKKAGLDVSDLHLVEINEAFAAVALWSARMLDIPASKVNVHGGAVALGHPLGATGARLVVTLINALRARGGGVGAATLCGGGGQGDAIIVKVA
jgi:acetyl-CoA C-acetyltransferase